MPTPEQLRYRIINHHTGAIINSYDSIINCNRYISSFTNSFERYEGHIISHGYQSNDILECTLDSSKIRYKINVDNRIPPAGFYTQEGKEGMQLIQEEAEKGYIGHIPDYVESKETILLSFKGKREDLNGIALIDKKDGNARVLENKIKLVGIICTAFLVGCVVISVSSIWTARTMVTDAQKKVYVLDGNVPILVNRTTMDETLDVEAKSHVEMFHHYFFTLPPDDKYIRYTMEKAMYLVDETGLAQYNTLKEKGFYSNILGTSAVFSIYCDSIRFDKSTMEFTYYGRQRIERRSNILMRELVTAGQLKRVPRTENNPHGLLIVNWRTLLNKDIEQKSKSNY